ncbi:MAG: helix-hairpin-helix domain-containing protein [Chloroflexi bacterium]|nr:helix-hairpin-helix domain-containing protein [Chloroflexota bacterium]
MANRLWAFLSVLLLAIILVSAMIIWTKQVPAGPVEIRLPRAVPLQGEIYIGGAVNSPGFYPLRAGDSVDDLVRAAGGASGGADAGRIALYLPFSGEEGPQKVDLNRAEPWLIQALPGIGQTRARAIIEYRRQNGRFNHISELLKVDGIGEAIFQEIKHLITVSD